MDINLIRAEDFRGVYAGPYSGRKVWKRCQCYRRGIVRRTTIFDDVFRVGRKGSESFPAILESHTPLDLIIIMLGTNDCKTVYGATAGIIGKGVETLIEQVKNYSPDSIFC